MKCIESRRKRELRLSPFCASLHGLHLRTQVCAYRCLFFRNSRNDCRISTAAIWSTTPARCRMLMSVSRNSRLASTEVRRSSKRWTGSLNLRRNSSANDLHLLGLNPFVAAHPQGQSHNQLGDLELLDHPSQVVQVVALVAAAQSRQPLGCNPQFIGHCQPNVARAEIQCQDAGRLINWLRRRKSIFHLRHSKSIMFGI